MGETSTTEADLVGGVTQQRAPTHP